MLSLPWFHPTTNRSSASHSHRPGQRPLVGLPTKSQSYADPTGAERNHDRLKPILRVDDMTVRYRNVVALEQVSFGLEAGKMLGILGANGAGKSTLMKGILGLIPTVSGQVFYDGQPFQQQRHRVAYVPQRSQIDWAYPATVWDVVLMGRIRSAGWLSPISASSRRIALDALERLGMVDYRDRSIGELSGGQQQRVFLARAMTQQADLFLLDEPFVGVDQKTQTIIFDLLRELTQDGKTILVVHHDLGASLNQFDELLLLNRRLIAQGDRATVMTPENLHQAYGSFFQLPQAA
ncbi:metal ABC transporter ATP-binding protein [Alkalinema pantanalense CENA528]|uniref:metal ABC transporter ATP-binding protein n=1 Tax=Alkalinema pantanalense TaxID=1620705 RepID=UPI003D6E82CD